MAQGALKRATNYAKQRKQFGQSIGEFQAIQFKLADMATRDRSGAVAASIRPLARRSKGRSIHARIQHGQAVCQRGRGPRRQRSVQIHGGYGFIKEYPAEKFYRDAKLCTIGEGTSEIQRLVIARQLLGKK